ncbi:MAG TPA: hypothetical protein VGC12_02015 [Methyloradius sp.]
MNWNRMDGNGKQGNENIAKINLKQHWDKLTEAELEMLNGKKKSLHVRHRDEFEPSSIQSRQHKRLVATTQK